MLEAERISNEAKNKCVELCNQLLQIQNSRRVASPHSLRLLSTYPNIMSFVKDHDKPFTVGDFDRIDQRDNFYRVHCDIIKVPAKYEKVWNQYKYLESLPQPVQKSPEWFAARENVISASSGAQAIDESKYDSQFELVKGKIGLGKPFKENMHVHHGKKLEYIATAIYEYIYNVKVGEFGLVPHVSVPKIDFLAASPDGICTCSTLDGEFSPMVGRMLEIKCVTFRNLNISGPEHMFVRKPDIDYGICPHYYWIQMQLQLECCDLEECDFWQCKIKNYWSRNRLEQMIKDVPTQHTVGQGVEIKIDPRLEYGTLIELMPINKEIPDDEKMEWYAAYIYPDKMDCSLDEKVEWALNMKENWKQIYPEYANDYKFGKILYYHMQQSHCYLVKRDRKWFRENLPKFAAFWDQVLSYRNDPVKKQMLIDQIASEELAAKKKIEEDNKQMAKDRDAITMDSDSD